MGTIVQEYGPFYGEAVNGTVSGRPNGSVYVPMSNKMTLGFNGTAIKVSGTNMATVGGGFILAADSQDLANYMMISIYSDSSCETKIAARLFSTGLFNVRGFVTIYGVEDAVMPSVGDDVYCRGELISVSNTVVSVSDVITLEVVS